MCPKCGYDRRATPECCPECGTTEAAAAELFGELGDVDGALAAETHADGAGIQGFGEEQGDFDGADLQREVDEVFRVGDGGLALLEVLARDRHHREAAALEEFQGLEGAGLEGDALRTLVLVKQLVHPVGVDAGFHQLGGEVHRERAGVGELEPAGVGADGQEQGRRDRLVKLDVPLLEDLEDDLPGRGGFGDDEFLRRPILLGEVVVDDELRFRVIRDALLEAGELRPGAGVDHEQGVVRFEREVGGEAALDVDERDGVLLVDERVFSGQVAEEQDGGVDAFLLHPQHHGGGGAEGVAVGADVGGDEHALAAREGVDHLAVAVGHRWRSYARRSSNHR